jgi:hypothetical protein
LDGLETIQPAFCLLPGEFWAETFATSISTRKNEPITSCFTNGHLLGVGGFFEKKGLHAGHLRPVMGVMIRTAVALVILGTASFAEWKTLSQAGTKPLLYMIVGGSSSNQNSDKLNRLHQDYGDRYFIPQMTENSTPQQMDVPGEWLVI